MSSGHSDQENSAPNHGQVPLHSFMDIRLELGEGVLVPREETELLGSEAVRILSDLAGDAIAVDMCCGCGNLALAIADSNERVKVWAADLTDLTVKSAHRNVERMGLDARVFIRQGDLFSALSEDKLSQRVDLIVCNPPYISSGRLDGESAHLLKDEPREAFDGGPYGISIHQRLVREAPNFLKPGGWLLFEFGLGQERQAERLIVRSGAYEPPTFLCDPDGQPRVARAQRTIEGDAAIPDRAPEG